jgi:hypothetical protein
MNSNRASLPPAQSDGEGLQLGTASNGIQAYTPSLTQPAPSPAAIRAELHDIIRSDLLGPAGGPEEEVRERVRDRYLVGILAPAVRQQDPEELEADEVGAAVAGSSDEGATDAGAPQHMSILPSSIGLTFCIDGTATEFRVTARWGRYTKVQPKGEDGNGDSEVKNLWRRTPVEHLRVVCLKEGPIREVLVQHEEHGSVPLQGVARRRESSGDWTITLFLVNAQREPKRKREEYWLFQPELIVEATDGAAIFTRRRARRAVGKLDNEAFAEVKALEMLYRRQAEFAIGHGVSVHWDAPSVSNPDRTTRVSTAVIPAYEVPRTAPPTSEEIRALAGLVLDMKELATTPASEFGTKLGALVTAYGEWIEEQRRRIDDPKEMLAEYGEAAAEALGRCETVQERIAAGLTLIQTNAEAAEAFRFMNDAMWRQRLHTRLSEARRRGEEATLDQMAASERPTWYPFQIAFVLLNLPGITDLNHPDRSDSPNATADLLWFPTGGGKTEAYLGLTAYTLALRRLQRDESGRSGEHGIAVLMRYTLRLLTLQQFQRAATLICACEEIRRGSADGKWGKEPFRVGLWVGNKSTPNTTAQSAEAIKLRNERGRSGGYGDPAQLTHCPWCGTEIADKDLQVDTERKRTIISCGDPVGSCLFTLKRSPGEGLPVLVVDEEIYRLLPSLLIATVDKFAQMPWNGVTQMLFGRVNGWCPRHGFRSPELEDADSHPKTPRLPAVKTEPRAALRPPDLIVQDELHLISGPLGSLVGLYESAVDYLATWEVDGKSVRPKVIASTATIRNARVQVHKTFRRQVSVFPPHGLDAEDSFFARQRPCSDDEPGRLYIGICAPGTRLKTVLIRVYLAALAGAQTLFTGESIHGRGYGESVDPWMTLVGYFGSMRELGGTRRLVDDEIRSGLRNMDRRGLERRPLYPNNVDELTSRRSSSEIPHILHRLETRFGHREKGKKYPLDVLLATNMLSVGVDVKRLGLMVVANQPKTTAEYIQATSRVGRSYPGLVCTVLNGSRPRDLSHYEQFEQYHATFYQFVEALSVTPFAPRALDRGLAALLVSCIRLAGSEFNDNLGAGRLERTHSFVQEAVEAISQRAWDVEMTPDARDRVRQELEARLDSWLHRSQNTAGGARLGYDRKRDGLTLPLLQRPDRDPWGEFTCLNSLRDVEPTVTLLLDDHGLDQESSFVPLVEAVPTEGGEENFVTEAESAREPEEARS